MDVYELACQGFQFGLCDDLVIHERPRTPILVKFATDNNLLAFSPHRLKGRFDHASFFAFGDTLAVGASAHNEVQRAQYDALARTCLTRHNGESLMEINVQVGDKCIVAYV